MTDEKTTNAKTIVMTDDMIEQINKHIEYFADTYNIKISFHEAMISLLKYALENYEGKCE